MHCLTCKMPSKRNMFSLGRIALRRQPVSGAGDERVAYDLMLLSQKMESVRVSRKDLAFSSLYVGIHMLY